MQPHVADRPQMLEPQIEYANEDESSRKPTESELLSRHFSQVQRQISEPSEKNIQSRAFQVRKTLTLKDTLSGANIESESGSRGGNFSTPLDETSMVHLVPREHLMNCPSVLPGDKNSIEASRDAILVPLSNG